jgi:D-threo-aldose 1-dehydrogenase
MAPDRIALAPRPLGATGLRVAPVAIGCAPLGDMPETFGHGVTERQALDCLRAAVHSPLNLLDTAGAYGDGESERRIGLALAQHGGLPESHVLATKAGRDPRTGQLGGERVRRSVERSLRLLGVDRLQLVHLHDPEHTGFDDAMARGGPVEALLALRDEGVVAHVGVAGGPPDLLWRYVETGAFEVVVTHNRFTLVQRGADALIAAAAQRGVAVLNAAPYGGGMLARGAAEHPRYAYRPASRELLAAAHEAARICARFAVPLAAAALQFSLRDPRITATIVGMSAPAEVQETVRLAELDLPPELWTELGRLRPVRHDPEEPAPTDR